LDRAAEIFESFDLALPRFQHYISRFEFVDAQRVARLEHVLVRYYAELIGTCQDLIEFFRKSTICMLAGHELRSGILLIVSAILPSRVGHID
jgi:hypothetical protein